MASTYRERIIHEIDSIPDAFLPKVYEMLHLLKTGFVPLARKKSATPLEGIWNGAVIEEDDFSAARRSLFPYENKP
jgi:hypothetical protein